MTFPNSRPLNFLILEDNAGDFLLFEEYLRQTNLNIVQLFHAESLSESESIIKEHTIDIVFLDLSLPDSQGIDSFVFLNKKIPDVPIVVLSGLSDVKVALECISLGAQDYLVKDELSEKLLQKSIHYSIERKKNLEKIRESKERYQLIAKATNDVVWYWNLLTNERVHNESIEITYGYGADQVEPGLDWWLNNIHPDDRKRVECSIHRCLQEQHDTWQEEYCFRCADGNYKYVFDRGFILRNKTSNPTQVIGAMMDITERQKLQDELLNHKLDLQKQITEATIQGQEKEREEIGRELHDNINQVLTTVKLYLGVAKENKEMQQEMILRSEQNINNAINEIRKLSSSLVPPSFGNHGLIDILKEMIDDVNMAGIFTVKLETNNFDENILDNERKLMLYRIIQEQFNNIIKYSKAENVSVILKTSDNHLMLIISDNGVGFDTSKRAKGIGLRNITSRVSFYSGNVKILSAPGKGAKLEVILPYKNHSIFNK